MITVNGIDYTKNCIYPKSKQTTLDESLNQGILNLRNLTRREPFESLSEVLIDGKEWLVAIDNVEQTRFGDRPLYKHSVTLIEKAKELEKYFVDSCTFRNPLVKLYLDNPIYASYYNLTEPDIVKYLGNTFTTYMDLASSGIYKKELLTPKSTANSVVFPKYSDLMEFTGGDPFLGTYWTKYEIFNPAGESIFSVQAENGVPSNTYTLNNPAKGTYKVYLSLWNKQLGTYMIAGVLVITVTFLDPEETISDYTITDVVNRLLAITETQRYGNTPKFSFNGTQATKYSSVLAPEFNFTKMTLFEALKEVGGYIHAIPELNGTEVSFHELDKREYADIKDNHVVYSASQNVDQFCSEIDTNVNNLVNIDDTKTGSIIEPYADGLKTSRMETGTAIITDDNCSFETTLPIESIDYLELGYLSDGTYIGDITKHVYEKSEYDALNSYSGEYPWSKAYALYFKQGTQNIYGLQFKEEDAISPVFKKQAIINIVEAITGGDYSTLFKNEPLIKLQYRIKYKPLIDARLKQRKSYIGATAKKAILAYNQSANKVDTDYYGENVKGVVERLGNIEKLYTYIAKKTDGTPEVGQLFNKDYYISVVSEEEYASYKKYTLGLSKDFNRRNEFVGIDNNKRYAEVDERSVQDRFVIYEDYLVLTDDHTIEEEKYQQSIITFRMLDVLSQNFVPPQQSQDFFTTNHVTCFYAVTYDKYMGKLEHCVLPSISSHFGNSVFYQISFTDNFGAGNKVDYLLTEHKGAQSQVEYADDYGRVEYIGFEGLNKPIGGYAQDYDTAVQYGLAVPHLENSYGNGLFNTDEYIEVDGEWETVRTPIILKKDSAERITLCYQIHCVTDKENVIIGSGLPKKLGIKNVEFSDPEHVDCYIMEREIGKFEKEISDLPIGTMKIPYTITTGHTADDMNNKQLTLGSITANANGQSIVLVDRETKELIFAINMDIKQGQSYQLPKMCFRHEIL